jgi:hypothetical protein
MKTSVIFLLCVLMVGVVNAQYTQIPDPNFEQALIDLGIDSDGVINGQVLTSDVEDVLFLDVHNRSISDLTGIQDFISLENLYCYDNLLTSLNILVMLQLKYYCAGIIITVIHLIYRTIFSFEFWNVK